MRLTRGQIGQELNAASLLRQYLMNGMAIVATPYLRGRIYVLARSIVHVLRLVDTVRCPYVDIRNMRSVPDEDRATVLYWSRDDRINERPFTQGTWVRMRRGPFKGEVGLVVCMAESDALTIAMPRRGLDSGGIGKDRAHKRERKRSRLREKTKEVHNIEPTCSQDRLDDASGVQVIQVYGIHAATPVIPSAKEVALFTRLGYNTLSVTNRSLLRIGDPVRVNSNESFVEDGVVKSISGDEACIDASKGRGAQEIRARLCNIERCMPIGSMVLVRIGPYTDRKGFVIGESKNEVIVLDEQDISEVCNVF